MVINLQELTADEVKRLSYPETLVLVDELEKISVAKATQMVGILGVEKNEDYRSFPIIIKNRIINGEFDNYWPKTKIKEKEKEKEKNDLLNRVSALISHFDFAFNIAKLQIGLADVVTDYNDKKRSIEEDIKTITKKTIAISSKAKRVEKQINAFEHTMLSHVLTIMGVFSAIITIILSVIITSSSWINNADKADAFVAFVVPNAVALMAVSLLLSLIFLHNRQNRINTEQVKHSVLDMFKSAVCYSIILVAILATIISSISLSLQNDIDPNPVHTLYILSPGEYQVQEEIVTPADPDAGVDEQKEYFYEFIFEDKLYRFEYNESLLHDGNLYFCTEHNSLE